MSQTVRHTGLTGVDAWAVAVDRPTWRALQPRAGYIHRVSKKKLCQCYFVNNSVKHWPNLIIFGMQHREET